MDSTDVGFMSDRHIDSPSVHLIKTHYVSRAPCNTQSEQLGRFAVDECKKRKIKCSYDITYGGKPYDLHYSEFFAGFGGIQIGACCGKLKRRMINRPYDETNNVDFAEVLNLASPKLHDKYLLHQYEMPRMRAVAILPGSNHLETLVDKEKLNAAVLLGAHVKMHPLTNKQHIDFVVGQYKDMVIPSTYSGYNCMLLSNVVYSTCSSELGLYAMLLGKRVTSIGTAELRGGYIDAFNRTIDASNQKDALNQFLNNPAVGIILPQLPDPEGRIMKFLDIYQEYLETHIEGVEIPRLTVSPGIT